MQVPLFLRVDRHGREILRALWGGVIAGVKVGPGAGDQVAEDRCLPGIFLVLAEVFGGVEDVAAGMPDARAEGHGLSHAAVDGFSGNGSVGVVGSARGADERIGALVMAAESAAVGAFSLRERIVVIAQESLRGGYVNLPLVLLHQLIPADAARVR